MKLIPIELKDVTILLCHISISVTLYIFSNTITSAAYYVKAYYKFKNKFYRIDIIIISQNEHSIRYKFLCLHFRYENLNENGSFSIVYIIVFIFVEHINKYTYLVIC